MSHRITAFRSVCVVGAALGAVDLHLACTPRDGRREPSPPSTVAAPVKAHHDASVPPSNVDCPAGLVAARRGGAAPDRYIVPEVGERSGMAAIVARLMVEGARARPLVEPLAANIGFRIEDVPEIPGVVLLREVPTRPRGGGAYLLRLEPKSRIAVQAPHTFFDEGTLPLACELFRTASAAALFIDTAHRYKAAEVDENGDHPADVAHSTESLFHAATEGFLRSVQNATVVQLHGFAPRESGAAAVLSSGSTERAVPLVLRAQEMLAPVVPGRVARFPDEAGELGATTNVQGALVRATGGRFLHVELSAGLRKALLADGAMRMRVMVALSRSLDAP